MWKDSGVCPDIKRSRLDSRHSCPLPILTLLCIHQPHPSEMFFFQPIASPERKGSVNLRPFMKGAVWKAVSLPFQQGFGKHHIFSTDILHNFYDFYVVQSYLVRSPDLTLQTKMSALLFSPHLLALYLKSLALPQGSAKIQGRPPRKG